MKKLLLVLSLSPLAVMAQHKFNASPVSQDKDKAVKMTPYTKHDRGVTKSPVLVHKENPMPSRSKRAYNANEVQIGVTYYDLMSNGSMPRRVITYPGGKVSVVWTNSSEPTKDFVDRGTAYNHFDGTSWGVQVNRDPQDITKFEPERAGWPNILSFDDNGTQKELIISHYASGGTGVSGGTFWMKNSGIGKTDFTTFLTKDKPNGPIWPRVAITGNKVHWIGVYSDTEFVYQGIKTPMVYYRYDLSTNTFDVENMLLPGYKERVARGSGDEYSIDSRGNTVAILANGVFNDVTLWKSDDQGENWTMTIIDSFPLAPYDATGDVPYDTTWTNDGTGTVTLDNDNVAHVFYPRMRIFNEDPSDGKYIPFTGTDGIVYWNDQTKDTQIIAARINYDGDDETDVLDGTLTTTQGGYGGSLSSYPVGAVDEDDNLYMVYSAPNEEDIHPDETNYRDLYIVYSRNGGNTWSRVQSITSKGLQEDVFPSLARDARDGKLHLVWMRDETPGIFLVNEIEIVQNKIMYAALSTDDILDNKLGLARVSVEEQGVNNLFSIGEVYPNPATNSVTIPVQMKAGAKVSVKVYDMLGKTLSSQNEATLGAGNSNLTLDVSTLNAGIYFCQVNAGGYSVTQKIVVR